MIQLFFRPLSGLETIRFLIGSVFVLVGLAIFLLGIETSITKIGNTLAKRLVHHRGLLFILFSAFFLGFIINIAEPDLMILAQSIESVTHGVIPSQLLVISVSVGVGIMVLVGFCRQIYSLSLRKLLWIVYSLIFILCLLAPKDYLPIAFDASGATTGAITTPFLLALSSGLSVIATHHDRDGADSFGLVGLASSGAIMAVLILGRFSGGTTLVGGGGENTLTGVDGLLKPFLAPMSHLLKEALISIGPLALLFFVVNFISKSVKRHELHRIIMGLVYCVIGLTLFTAGVSGSFMATGEIVGVSLASSYSPYLVIFVAFFLGMTTVLAEPAVQVLTQQIESDTGGYLPRKLVLLFLSLGVALAVGLAVLRINVPSLQLWHLLLPAYLVALLLSRKSGELFTGIAFDSGGVVSGPMTATFVLAFAQGVARQIPGADVILDGFGVIALVAVSPLVSLGILGIIYQSRIRKGDHHS